MQNNSNTPRLSTRLSLMASTVALSAFVAGCANVPNPNPQDPWESYNRSMTKFNDAVDGALFKPIATGYRQITPEPARTCIHNIFANMADLWSSVNSFLQGRGHDGINSFGRVLFNSTMGLGGCIDVASMNGTPRIPNDMGTTLGVWGFGSGPYVVLPFLGASTVRDGIGTGIATAASLNTGSLLFHIDDVPLRNSLVALNTIDLRASLLYADDMVNRIALDRYSFIRDAYLQRRKAMIEGTLRGVSASEATAPAQQTGTLPNYEDEDLPNYEDDEDVDQAPAAGAPAAP